MRNTSQSFSAVRSRTLSLGSEPHIFAKTAVNASQLLRSRTVQAALIFLFFSVLFVVFRSNYYTAVDGALRCAAVYQRQEIFFHDNRHLLYPFNVFVWHRLLQTIGVQATDVLQFIGLTQVMNAAAAAGCLAILYSLAHSITHSLKIALAVTVGYGFSRAFLLHATNSAEPMVGLLWSFVAVQFAALSLRRRKPWLLCVSGLFLALAMATYQSMVLIAPGLLVFCLGWGSEKKWWLHRAGSVVSRLSYFAAGAGISAAVIYALAYSHSGTHGLAAMVGQFFSVPHVTGITGLGIGKVLNAPLGFASNVIAVLPPGFSGIRSLLREHSRDLWLPWIVLILSALISFLVLNLILARRAHFNRCERMTIAGVTVAFVTTLAGPLYVDPNYDKLWLLPIACFMLLVGILTHVNRAARFRKPLLWLGVCLLSIEIATSVVWLSQARSRSTPYLPEAQQVAEIVGPRDLVITGWDDVSTIYEALYSHRNRVIILPMAAGQRGRLVIDDIEGAITDAHQNGAQVYFLGVLDLTRESWDGFLGKRRNVPYDAFDSYRRNAQTIANLENSGLNVTLRRLEHQSFSLKKAIAISYTTK